MIGMITSFIKSNAVPAFISTIIAVCGSYWTLTEVRTERFETRTLNEYFQLKKEKEDLSGILNKFTLGDSETRFSDRVKLKNEASETLISLHEKLEFFELYANDQELADIRLVQSSIANLNSNIKNVNVQQDLRFFYAGYAEFLMAFDKLAPMFERKIGQPLNS